MKNLQEATEKICDLKGSMLAMDALMAALLRTMPVEQLSGLAKEYATEVEALQTVPLNAKVSELTIAASERDVRRVSAILHQKLP